MFVPLESLYTGKHILSQNTQYSILNRDFRRMSTRLIGTMSTRLAVGVGGLVVAWGALRIFAKGERHDGSIRRAYPRGLMKGDKVCMEQASFTSRTSGTHSDALVGWVYQTGVMYGVWFRYETNVDEE